jgi:integrase/recombinase XerC
VEAALIDTKRLNQGIITDFALDNYLTTWVEQFLLDKKVQNVAAETLRFYGIKLEIFGQFCETQAVNRISQIDANFIRHYLLWLESEGHNPDGVHGHFRALKTFIYWWENQGMPEDWKNPFKRVKAPRVGKEPLELAGGEAIESVIRPVRHFVRHS